MLTAQTYSSILQQEPAAKALTAKKFRNSRGKAPLAALLELLNRLVIEQDDPLLPDNLTGFGRDGKLKLRLAHLPAARFNRSQFGVAQAGMQGPLAQARWQIAQQLCIGGWLAVRNQTVAIKKII